MIFWADCRKNHAFRKFYRFITNHNTNQYDKIAMAIDAIHIGITVLSRYPTPNVRKPPFSVYINPGFVIWTPVNNKIKNRMATLNLWFRRNSFIPLIEFSSCYILATKKLALVYSSHRNGLLIPSQWSTHPIAMVYSSHRIGLLIPSPWSTHPIAMVYSSHRNGLLIPFLVFFVMCSIHIIFA